jgi:hypothetical protein
VECSPNGKKRNAYRLLGGGGKPEGKRPLGKPRRRWLDNIRMDRVEVAWGDVHCIGPALVNEVMNLRVL